MPPAHESKRISLALCHTCDVHDLCCPMHGRRLPPYSSPWVYHTWKGSDNRTRNLVFYQEDTRPAGDGTGGVLNSQSYRLTVWKSWRAYRTVGCRYRDGSLPEVTGLSGEGMDGLQKILPCPRCFDVGKPVPRLLVAGANTTYKAVRYEYTCGSLGSPCGNKCAWDRQHLSAPRTLPESV